MFAYRENDEPSRDLLRPLKLSTFAEERTPDKSENDSHSSEASYIDEKPANRMREPSFDAAIFDERLELRSVESDQESSPALSCDDPVTNQLDG